MTFTEKVVEAIRAIPSGRVTTYGTIALMAGSPRGGRLVGGILRHQTEKYDLPWQRVINSQGLISIRGSKYHKGMQKALLEAEGVEVSEEFMVDLQKFGWWGEIDSQPKKLKV